MNTEIRQEKRNRGIEADATIPDILKAKYETDYLKNLIGLGIVEREFFADTEVKKKQPRAGASTV